MFGVVVFGFEELKRLDEPVGQSCAREGIEDAASLAALLHNMMGPEDREVL